ncbi:MAG TPA: cbb3-type cytochrome c oxidase subunit 3 [Telluria sp.]|nr:cbb3-type cytochrome c oxidase subunit 3 [Telluria sp.]
MDINMLRSIATVACFVTFLGIVWYAYAARNRARFDAAALIPFDHD